MTDAARRLFEERLADSGGSPERALAEVIQFIALLGLSRTDFFSIAAFYGGTAMRMLLGLDRFSEDLDFSLDRPRPGFSLEKYLQAVSQELESYGFTADVILRIKTIKTPIESAFVKANTRAHLLSIRAPASIGPLPRASQATRVKFEVDTDPPEKAGFSVAYLTIPIPFSVRSYDNPSLFAGKLAVVLARSWKDRVKGRDWYDFVFYLARGIPVSVTQLEQRLRQTGYFESPRALTQSDLKLLIHERIDELDVDAARRDVEPFVVNPRDLEIWSRGFFHNMTERLTATEGE